MHPACPLQRQVKLLLRVQNLRLENVQTQELSTALDSATEEIRRLQAELQSTNQEGTAYQKQVGPQHSERRCGMPC